ncbi:ribosomal protein S18 acetylase RimI-like enzyme [Luteimonas cucumeris]|uniref:Ribosomal protein S18 acetylase RimI-like enzyme n=1 Tax=Luteimonas cucumeris TaxID=985012 RepID=A0A562KXW6_9GAMM|nr:GNAT family N-acetyltransferase [Luteimonas cucumeris]TWI00235.1 ribosomal protein S18 acetylase RimI-like enzyme [Luteimonas cucumeris]
MTSKDAATAPPVIREIAPDEFETVWPIFQEVIAGQETYAYDPALSVEQARAMWTSPPARCFVAEADGEVLGCYRIAPNYLGPGDHVANGSYMVASAARGRGIGALLCAHSLQEARRAGFAAMQFNIVVSTNTAAVKLWQRHGFEIVGTVPAAFRHPRLGLVDTYVMYRSL